MLLISYFYFMMQMSSHCQTLWEKLPVIISIRVSYPDTLFDSSAIIDFGSSSNYY